MAHILLTRPETLSNSTAETLRGKGHTVTVAPTSNPNAIDHPNHETPTYIVSSRHGVKFGLELVSNKDALVFAVGEKAGGAATAAGFANVISTPDANALLKTIKDKISPEDGAITHLCGAHISTNICAALTRDGFDATANVVYEAVALPLDNSGVMDVFAKGEIDVVLFYSARAITIFEGWLKEAGAQAGCKTTTAAVLSHRIELALSRQWVKRAVSDAPNEDSLFTSAGL